MTVIVGIGPRTRAMAVRLEHSSLNRVGQKPADDQWICTAIEAA